MPTKFFLTKLSFEVLSEGKLQVGCLSDILNDHFEMEVVGDLNIDKEQGLTGKEMADALAKFGSEPGFFSLDAEGNFMEEATRVIPHTYGKDCPWCGPICGLADLREVEDKEE